MSPGLSLLLSQALFEMGDSSRQVRKTGMNDTSSRSHLLFTIKTKVTNRKNNKILRGKMVLVDLAGSERLSRTQLKTKEVRSDCFVLLLPVS